MAGVADSSARRRLVEKALDDDAVAPRAVELPVATIHADDAESAALVQREACGVFRKDPRHELPEPTLGVDAAQGLQRGPSRALTSGRACHVDRVPCDTGVCGTIPIRTGARPGDDLVTTLGHDRWEAVALVDELHGDLLRRSRLGLERRDAIGDALVIDVGNRSGVRRYRKTRADLVHPRPRRGSASRRRRFRGNGDTVSRETARPEPDEDQPPEKDDDGDVQEREPPS